MNNQYKIQQKDVLKKGIPIKGKGILSRGKQLKELKAGDMITFGQYKQGKQGEILPLEWLVLSVSRKKALLMCKHAIASLPYNIILEPVTWQTCSIRRWLNSEFIRTAFNEEERNQIILRKTYTPDNSEYGTDGGECTEDNIFLLSIEEAERYFKNNDARMCIATKAAYEEGRILCSDNFEMDGRKTVWWWLRSPGLSDIIAARVHTYGDVHQYGNNVSIAYVGVRPALFLNLES